MIILLLLNSATLIISIWSLKKSFEGDLIENIIVLEIASAIFNLLFGLFLLFDFMETHPAELFKNLFADLSALIWLLTCFSFSILHFILAFIFFRKNWQAR